VEDVTRVLFQRRIPMEGTRKTYVRARVVGRIAWMLGAHREDWFHKHLAGHRIACRERNVGADVAVAIDPALRRFGPAPGYGEFSGRERHDAIGSDQARSPF
jgi:hypothetical protein